MGHVRMHIWCFQQIDVEMRNCHLWTSINDLCECSSILGSLPPPRGLCACRRRFYPSENTPLDFMSMHFIDFVIFNGFQGPLVNNPKYGRSAQMTMPARCSSKFCAKRRAVLLPIIFLSLICRVIPANIEPSPECQPGNQINKYPRSIGLINITLINIHAQVD